MGFDTYNEVLAHILDRALEDSSDTSGDFYDLAGDAILQAWRELWSNFLTLDLVKDPPGAFVTTAAITSLTITIAAAGEGVTGTLSATYASSLTGLKLKADSKEWYARITSHASGSATVTLDAAPEALAAGTAITIYQDEYQLASDLGVLVDGLWSREGFVPLRSEEELRREWNTPTAGELPAAFCRLTRRRIRLSHYPTEVRRYEYPYQYEPTDPSGDTEFVIGSHLRAPLAEKALSVLLDMKFDRRAAETEARAIRLYGAAEVYERRRRMGLATTSSQRFRGAYGA